MIVSIGIITNRTRGGTRAQGIKPTSITIKAFRERGIKYTRRTVSSWVNVFYERSSSG